MQKVPQLTLEEAAKFVKTGDTILVGGFGMTGNPVHLLHALAETSVTGLTFVGNNVGEAGLGGGRLLRNGQIDKAIGSYFTSNREAVAAAQSGEISVELLPQGTLAEALRAGGAGIGGFFVRPAWARSWRCKSSRELTTASEVKRNCVRVTERGEEADSETVSR